MCPAMRLSLALVGCVLVLAYGCRRSQASEFWSYDIIDHGKEAFTEVVVSYPGHTWPHGNTGPGLGGDHMGVIGEMPDEVDLSLTSDDGIRHKIHVLVPPRPPARYEREIAQWYLLILSRYHAIATWTDPDSMYLKVFWSCAPGVERFSDVTAFYGHSDVVGQRLGASASGVTTIDPRKLGTFDNLDVGFTSADGLQHKVHVVLPEPITSDSRAPDIHLLIESRDKVTATYTYPTPKVQPRWFCTFPPNDKETDSDLIITADGRTYALGSCGPSDDASLSALGPLPKAVEVSFRSRDGKQHKVHVDMPAQLISQPPHVEPTDYFYNQDAKAAAQRGPQPPHVDLVIKSGNEVLATVAKPYQVKRPPSWYCEILNNSTEPISDLTIACDDGKPERLSNEERPGGGFGMQPDGHMPTTVTIGFVTKDGTRHSIHVDLPSDAKSLSSGIRLVIESRDKVAITEPGWKQ